MPAMSIAVSLDGLDAALAEHPWGYLVTVGDDQRARLHAAPTRYEDGTLVVVAGTGSRGNAIARPDVTLVFPPVDPRGASLIVDGVATVEHDAVRVRPTWAVLHRSAIPAPDGDGDGEVGQPTG